MSTTETPQEAATGKTLTAMTQEIEEWGRTDGWYDAPVSFGEAMAYLHSEVSEALEAWREWGTADGTDLWSEYDERDGILLKPEGVGSEFADVIIRLLDSCIRFGVDLEAETGQRPGLYTVSVSFPENMSMLHDHISRASMVYDMADPWEPYGAVFASVYVFLRQCCDEYGIDLAAEYDRKMAFNRAHPHRHGKRQ